jgi:hypothetical protein
MRLYSWIWIVVMVDAVSCAVKPAPMSPEPAGKTVEPDSSIPLATATALPAARPPATTVRIPATTTFRPEPAGQKLDLDAFAPPGPERDLLVQNCGICHSFVCALRGQRTAEHWQAVRQNMRYKVGSLDDRAYDALFAYLAANFNDQKPEPVLPPEFQDLGCSSGVR